MIIQEPEQVVQTLQENWLGREVRVTKTEPGTTLQFSLGGVRVVGRHEVPDPVREKLPAKTRFMALSGQGDQVYTVLVRWTTTRSTTGGRTVW